MVLKERDYKILDLVSKFKIINSEFAFELVKEFKSEQTLRRRLRLMHKNKVLKRDRNAIGERYLYFERPVKQIRHRLLLLEFYSLLSNMIEITRFETEYKLFDSETKIRKAKDIIADALCEIKRPDGKKRLLLIEVQINNKFNFEKYKTAYNMDKIQKEYGVFPTLVIISDQKLEPPSLFKNIIIKTNFKNIKEVLE